MSKKLTYPVDYGLICRAAKRLIAEGKYPSRFAVAQATNNRWNPNMYGEALRHLRDTGLLVVPHELESNRNSRKPPPDDHKAIENRIALIRDTARRLGRSLEPRELNELFGCTSKQERKGNT